MSILFGVIYLHILHFFQELRGKILQVIQIGRMDMKHIRMSGNLYLYSINLYQFVSILYVFLIDEVIRVTRVHYDYDPILNALLTNGEHNFVELFFIRPLFRFIANKSSNTLNGFQFRRLIPRRCFDTPKHDTTLSHFVDYIHLGGLEIFCSSVKVYLLHHFRDDRHTGGNHRVTGIENLMHNLLYRGHFKSQTLYKGGSVERLSRTTSTGDKNYKFLFILIQRMIYFLGFDHFSLSLIQESILIP